MHLILQFHGFNVEGQLRILKDQGKVNKLDLVILVTAFERRLHEMRTTEKKCWLIESGLSYSVAFAKLGMINEQPYLLSGYENCGYFKALFNNAWG